MKHKKILVFIIILSTVLIGLCTCGKDIISNSDLPLSTEDSFFVPPFMEAEKEPEILRFVDVKGNWHEVEILEDVKKHTYDWDYLTNDENGLSYVGDENYTVRKGIDVSKWQDKIDWEQVKAAGYEFAFLRLGYRGYGTEGKMEIDSTFYYNIQNARKYGIDLGVYFFSQAINETEALEEADFVLSALEGYKLQLPIVYDPELISHDDARTDNVTGEQFTKNTITFCDAIKAAGYEPMVYSNMVWEATLFDMTKLQDYDFWYADYEAAPQTPYDFTFWQYTESGKVPGIEGNVDLNLQFIPTKEADSGAYDFTLCFAGDISLDESAVTTRQLNASENGIYGCISPELIEIMQQAELMCLNNEFTYSTNGSPMSGKAYLDAGADAIIGGHSHCLQGMEFYNNKPIIYSLGNYWFNSRTLDSMLVQLRFYGDDNGGNVEVSVVPAIQKNAKTQIVTDAAEMERIFSYLEDISINVDIDENGMVTQLP